MRKYKLKLNKSRKQNSGKTWETPTYLFLENIEYDVDVKNENIYIFFDFIKYEIKFNINDRKLYTSLLNQICFVFSSLKYTDDLKNTVEKLESLTKEEMFVHEHKDIFKDDGTIETQSYIKMNLEYAEELADIKRKLNSLLYQIPLHFCFNSLPYHHFKNKGVCEILAIDKKNTVQAIRKSGWNNQLLKIIEKLDEHRETLEHWKREYEKHKSWFYENKVDFYQKLIANTEAKIKRMGG